MRITGLDPRVKFQFRNPSRRRGLAAYPRRSLWVLRDRVAEAASWQPWRLRLAKGCTAGVGVVDSFVFLPHIGADLVYHVELFKPSGRPLAPDTLTTAPRPGCLPAARLPSGGNHEHFPPLAPPDAPARRG